MNDQVDDAVSTEIQDIAAGLKKTKTLQSLKVGKPWLILNKILMRLQDHKWLCPLWDGSCVWISEREQEFDEIVFGCSPFALSKKILNANVHLLQGGRCWWLRHGRRFASVSVGKKQNVAEFGIVRLWGEFCICLQCIEFTKKILVQNDSTYDFEHQQGAPCHVFGNTLPPSWFFVVFSKVNDLIIDLQSSLLSGINQTCLWSMHYLQDCQTIVPWHPWSWALWWVSLVFVWEICLSS